MDQQRRKELVELAKQTPLEWTGLSARVSGYANPNYATINTEKPGFYGIAWFDLERVLTGLSTLDEEYIWKTSNAWLGAE